jgi:Transglycosylase SLT domain
VPKSIFEIDIDDTKAKAYFALVEKYQQNIAKLPGMWGKVALAEQPIVAALAAQTQLLSRVVDGEKRVAAEAERAERSWRGISTYTKNTAANFASIALTAAKWTGITSILSTIVGAVSLDRLAGAVSGTRRAAGGLGISYGQQQAFGLDLGRFVDPGAVLGASRNALYDITNPAYIGLRAAGINPEGGNAASVSAQLLERLPSLFAGTPQGLVGPRARSLGLDQFFSLDDIVRYLGASPGERKTQLQSFQQDAKTLDLQKQVTRGWQDFETQLSRAGLGIENVFVKGLTPLIGPLGKLSGSVERAIETFLSGADKWIGPFGEAIEKFAKYLVGPEFQTDLVNFKDSIGEIASAVGSAAAWIKGLVPDNIPGVAPPGHLFDKPKVSIVPGSIADKVINGVTGAYGLLTRANAEGDLMGLVRDLERSGDSAVSPKGAIGRYQITPDTARTYGRDPAQLTDPTYNAQTANLILRKLVAKYHGDIDKVLLAYHSGEGVVDNPARFPTGPEGRGYLDRAHANPGYQKVIVEIHDATGASAVTAGSQIGLGGTP